jgi:hypothetical protein
MAQKLFTALRVSSGHIIVGNDLRVELNDVTRRDVEVDNLGTIIKISIHFGTNVVLEIFF